jgi:hypothetical protein
VKPDTLDPAHAKERKAEEPDAFDPRTEERAVGRGAGIEPLGAARASRFSVRRPLAGNGYSRA